MAFNKLVLKYFDEANAPSAQMIKSAETIKVQIGEKSRVGVVILYLQIKSQKILSAAFKAYGSVTFIAAIHFGCSLLTGKNINTVSTIDRGIIISELGLSAADSIAADYFIAALTEALENGRKQTYNN